LISRHPLTLYQKQIEQVRPVLAAQMHHFVGRRITMVGWLITEKAVESKDGQAMEFITLEDVTALYDATLFPHVYRRCHQLLSSNRPYVVRGVVEEAFGVVTLTVSDLQLLESNFQVKPQSRDLKETWYGSACDLTVSFRPS
ncbi:MAG TPA: OB-fold nucleic acid binding domain-containing protein, partial [Nitrospiraceae bacterium]